jgi:hypothetical protein
MSSFSVLPLIMRRWQARPSWTSSVAIALGLHALVLAVPAGFEPLRNPASVGSASRGALVDLSDQLGLPALGSSPLQPLRLPGISSLPLPIRQLPSLPVPSLPPAIKPVDSAATAASDQLFSLDLASEARQPQPLDSKPSRPSLEMLLNSITGADQPLGFSPAEPSSYFLDDLAADERSHWFKSLRRLTFDLSWLERRFNVMDLQQPPPEDLAWPDSFRPVFSLRLRH